MKINNLGNNQVEVITENKVLFFSYNTCVACQNEDGFFKTSKKWSNTTSKHINQWLDGRKVEEKSQEFFDSLV